MAFTDVPLITLVADGLVRLSNSGGERAAFGLAEGATGTIGLHEDAGTPDVRLPAAFKPRHYTGVTLQDSVQCYITKTGLGITEVPVTVVKTGTLPTDFTITLVNTIAAEGGGVAFELYIRFH